MSASLQFMPKTPIVLKAGTDRVTENGKWVLYINPYKPKISLNLRKPEFIQKML